MVLLRKANHSSLTAFFRIPGFPGLTSSGDYVAYTFTSGSEKIVKIRVEDLADTPFGTPPDGSTISYNAATSKWEYVSGGGGGSVDSVNGETGVVSLGIQEMDDYQLSIAESGAFALTEREPSSGGDFTNPEGWTTDFSGSLNSYYMVWSKTAVGSSEIYNLSNGDALEFTFDGGTPFSTTVNGSPQVNSPGTYYMKINDAWPSEAATASVMIIKAAGFTGVIYAPLAEGNILKWNSIDQKFNPSTASVESVNGETGVIDLEIQDMDDFQLAGPSGVTIYRYDNFTGTSSGGLTADGDWAVFTSGANVIYFRKVDSNGDQIGNDALFPTTTGSQGAFVDLYASNDGVTWFRVNNYPIFDDSTYWSMSTDATSQAAIVQSGTLYLSFQDPTVAPLAEGDILQWNDTNQKFVPAQLVIKTASYSDPVGGQSLDSQTATVITGITNVVTENPIYSNSAGVVTVSEAGIYELYGCVGATGNTANYRWTTEFDVRVDGTMVARQVGGYIRASNDSNFSDIAITTIVELTAGQEIDFTLRRVSNITGNAVALAHTSRILIKKLS